MKFPSIFLFNLLIIHSVSCQEICSVEYPHGACPGSLACAKGICYRILEDGPVYEITVEQTNVDDFRWSSFSPLLSDSLSLSAARLQPLGITPNANGITAKFRVLDTSGNDVCRLHSLLSLKNGAQLGITSLAVVDDTYCKGEVTSDGEVGSGGESTLLSTSTASSDTADDYLSLGLGLTALTFWLIVGAISLCFLCCLIWVIALCTMSSMLSERRVLHEEMRQQMRPSGRSDAELISSKRREPRQQRRRKSRSSSAFPSRGGSHSDLLVPAPDVIRMQSINIPPPPLRPAPKAPADDEKSEYWRSTSTTLVLEPDAQEVLLVGTGATESSEPRRMQATMRSDVQGHQFSAQLAPHLESIGHMPSNTSVASVPPPERVLRRNVGLERLPGISEGPRSKNSSGGATRRHKSKSSLQGQRWLQ